MGHGGLGEVHSSCLWGIGFLSLFEACVFASVGFLPCQAWGWILIQVLAR